MNYCRYFNWKLKLSMNIKCEKLIAENENDK